jgi:hypothetical protein
MPGFFPKKKPPQKNSCPGKMRSEIPPSARFASQPAVFATD